MSSDEKPPILTSSALVPVGAIAAAVLMMAAVMAKLNSIENSIATLVHQTERIQGNQWSTTHMAIWVDRTKVTNPTLNLPSPQEIRALTEK